MGKITDRFVRSGGGVARRLRAVSIGWCLFLLLGFGAGFAAVGAQAAPPQAISAFGFSHLIGEPTLGAPTWSGSTQSWIAVDEVANQVFVPGNELSEGVEVFAGDAGPTDEPITSFGESSAGAVGIDQSNGDVYLKSLNGRPTGFFRYLSTRTSTPTFTVDPTFNPVYETVEGGVAVDPTTGDVITAEPLQSRVRRLSPSGALISEFPVPSGFNPDQIYVAADGTIFVYDKQGTFERVVHYSAAGAELATYTLGISGASNRLLGFAYDDAHETLILVSETKKEQTFALVGLSLGDEELFRVPFPNITNPGISAGNVHGVALDQATGNLYVLMTERQPQAAASLLMFETAWRPGLEAPTASAITTETMHLSAELDPGPGPPAGSEARFEYSADNGSTWTWTPYQSDAAGSIEADIGSLDPNVEYLVRVRASNAKGTFTSPTAAFTTEGVPPSAATEEAFGVTEDGATLTGRIDPVGLQTRYRFDYGPTDSYGSSVPLGPEALAGAAHGSRLFEQAIAGLQPGTTYHYRVVAVNAKGTSYGFDRTFTTQPAGAIPLRGYEQVSPVDHMGGSIEAFKGFFVGTSSDAMSYTMRAPGASGESAPSVGRLMSTRSAGGWDARGIDAPVNVMGTVIYRTVGAVATDFGRDLLFTNRKLTPDAIESNEGVNLYVNDLRTGQKTLIASSQESEAFNNFGGHGKWENFIAAAPDLSWIIFYSQVPLGNEGIAGGLYEWSEADGLELVSRLPNGNPTAVQNSSVHVSADGSRIYFDDPGEIGYVREDGQTKAITLFYDEPEIPIEGWVMGTSSNGRYAFISSIYPLIPGAPEEYAPNLIFRYDAVTGEMKYLEAEAHVTLKAAFYGASEDGETLYYGGDNGIEEWRDGEVRQIAPEKPQADLVYMSENGRYLAYPDDAGIRGPFAPEQDIYVYDSDAGTAACASCINGELTEASRLAIAENFINAPQASPLANDGAVFFTSSAPLVPSDINGKDDVYEYDHGHLTLISPGDAPFNATFSAVSNDMSNVYFTTEQALVSQDTNRELDVYDARVGGGIPAQNPPSPAKPCSGESCQGATGLPPVASNVGSETTTASSPPKHKKQANQRCKANQGGHGRRRPKTCGKQGSSKGKSGHRKPANRRQGTAK